MKWFMIIYNEFDNLLEYWLIIMSIKSNIIGIESDIDNLL